MLRMRGSLLVVLLALLPALSVAFEAKCSACKLVAMELQLTLEAEKPRNHVDLRGRIDSKGVRYGKIIPYKYSEVRVIEVLNEQLCDKLPRVSLQKVAGVKGRVWRELSDEDEKALDEIGQSKVKQWNKDFKSYCSRVVEHHEDELTEIIRSDDFNVTKLPETLCGKMQRDCVGEDWEAYYLEQAAQGEGAGDEGAAAADGAQAEGGSSERGDEL